MKTEEFKKRIDNIHDKTEYAIHVRNLKQALNRGLVWRKTMILKKTFLVWWIMHMLEKLWKILQT